ncbi:hypothetical protein [Streptomyces sp. HNM0574]|uniref:hypothetical protein n=1 Tax=Streptomyces sp. HNM0574 TaxID=2714954 RepID=UPI00146A04EC|nr:hypothetical protein [Streptomyces sp. HNM0574]NLU65801.1 hypothetical protein [Streptomyces sp. HNM0574]
MFRRLTVPLAVLLAAVCLGTGTATAAPSGDHDRLTPKERAGLRFAGEVTDNLLGGGLLR